MHLFALLGLPCLAVAAAVVNQVIQAPAASTGSSTVISGYVQNLEQRAAEGHVRAETCLGEMYQSGVGVLRNFDKAIALFQKATAKGDTEGTILLTMVYRQARDFIDFPSALVKVITLAHQGNPYAESVLGLMYFYGLDYPAIRIDYKKALHWFQKSAGQDDPLAESMLAFMYQYGWGVHINPARAREWRERIANHSFSCYVDFADSTTGLIESNMKVPHSLRTGKVSGTVTLLIPYNNRHGARPVILKSSGHQELDRAVLAAAADQTLPTWTYVEKGEKFALPFALDKSLFNPDIGREYLEYYWNRLVNAVVKTVNLLWANQPYHSTATRPAEIRFECNNGHTQAVTTISSSGDALIDRLSQEAVEQTHCPPWPGGVALAKSFTVLLGDPWDMAFFNDPQDRPRTPYAMHVRAAIARTEVVPRHVLLYGTSGTGITLIAFKVRDGKITDLRIVKPSGDAEIDTAALAAARHAKLPKAPSSLVSRTVSMTMHVNFPVQSPQPKPGTE